jgi:hypothetical protein
MSAWHAELQPPSDVRTYHQWIMGALPSWTVPGPYPVVADLLWWPLRWSPGPNANLWWLLGWTGPATALACLLLWRTATRPTLAVSVWLLSAAILERSYWMRLDPIAATLTLATVIGVRRRRVVGPALALSAGSLIKVWPVFLLPMALLGLPRRARLRLLAWFGVPWLLYALAVVALHPPGGSTWLTFTLTRRTQAESLTALPALWSIVAGSSRWTVVYTEGLDSADLVIGPYLSTIHAVLEAIALVILCLLVVRLGRWLRACRPIPGAVMPGEALSAVATYLQTALLVIVIFAGPVFSPQYLTWFAPVLVLAIGDGRMALEVGLWLVACALTTMEFPWLWDEIRQPQLFAVGVLTLRDVVLLGLLALCLRRFWQLTLPPKAVARAGRSVRTATVTGQASSALRP